MYSNIKVYQKYLATSIKVGCATRSLYASSGPKAEGVPTNNQRGRGSGPCRLWGGLDKARHIVPTALLVRVQRFRNDLYKAVKGPSTRPIVLSMIAGSYWRRRRRFTIFEPDEMKFAFFNQKVEKWCPKVPKQAKAKRDSVINPQNYNFYQF